MVFGDSEFGSNKSHQLPGYFPACWGSQDPEGQVVSRAVLVVLRSNSDPIWLSTAGARNSGDFAEILHRTKQCYSNQNIAEVFSFPGQSRKSVLCVLQWSFFSKSKLSSFRCQGHLAP